MSILSIVLMALQFLPQLLLAVGVITPSMEALIADLATAIPGLISGLVAGKQDTDKVIVVLRALQTEIGTLLKDTTIAPHSLLLVSSLSQAIDESLAAYGKAGEVCDPSTLTILPESL